MEQATLYRAQWYQNSLVEYTVLTYVLGYAPPEAIVGKRLDFEEEKPKQAVLKWSPQWSEEDGVKFIQQRGFNVYAEAMRSHGMLDYTGMQVLAQAAADGIDLQTSNMYTIYEPILSVLFRFNRDTAWITGVGLREHRKQAANEHFSCDQVAQRTDRVNRRGRIPPSLSQVNI